MPFEDLRHLRLRYLRTILVWDLRTFQDLDRKWRTEKPGVNLRMF